MQPKKLFYSMGEVSEMFDVKPSLLRFWESEFDVLKPKRNKKGNRMFTPEDIENLKLIHYLVKERRMTLDGARKALRQNRGGLSRDAELLERLQKVRAELVEVRDGLKNGGGLFADSEAAAAEPESPDAGAKSVERRGKGPVEVIEPRRQRGSRRRRDEDEPQSKELFAFYEQSLF